MEYWTIIDDRHAGPFSAEELIAKGIELSTPVWYTGLPDWVEAREIPELLQLIEANGSPAPAEAAAPAHTEDPCHPQEPSCPEETAELEPEVPVAFEEPEPAPAPAQQWQNPNEQPWQSQPVQQPQPVHPKWEWQEEPKPIPEGAEIPPAYLVWSIIVTVLCCLPLGVPAIVFSAQTQQAIKRGNLEKASKMSKRAQWFIILAIVVGLITLPLQIIFSSLG